MEEYFKDEKRKEIIKKIDEALKRAERNYKAQLKYLEYLEIHNKNKRQQEVEKDKLENIIYIQETLKEIKKCI